MDFIIVMLNSYLYFKYLAKMNARYNLFDENQLIQTKNARIFHSLCLFKRMLFATFSSSFFFLSSKRLFCRDAYPRLPLETSRNSSCDENRCGCVRITAGKLAPTNCAKILRVDLRMCMIDFPSPSSFLFISACFLKYRIECHGLPFSNISIASCV